MKANAFEIVGITTARQWPEQTIAIRSASAPIDQWVKSRPFVEIEQSYAALFRNRLRTAVAELQESVEIDPSIRSGVPVLKGTRMPLSGIFAELAGGMSIVEIADDFDLDEKQLESVLNSFATYLDQPLGHASRIPARQLPER